MESLQLPIDPAWGAGLALALTRVGGFAIASPLVRVVPAPGRLAFAVAMAFFLASPPQVEPTVAFLVAAAAVNAAIGVALGFLTGLVMHLFPVGGAVIDMTSGMAAAAVFDPGRGEQAAIFSRMFGMVGTVLFYAAGGAAILVRGLHLSVRAIPLDGSISGAGGLAAIAAETTGRLFLAGVELALPVLAALFLTELVLGVASRFAPQANVFIVGLPAKIFVAFSMTSLCFLLFPETLDGAMRTIERSMTDVLRALGA